MNDEKEIVNTLQGFSDTFRAIQSWVAREMVDKMSSCQHESFFEDLKKSYLSKKRKDRFSPEQVDRIIDFVKQEIKRIKAERLN